MDSLRAVALVILLPYLKLGEQHLGGAGHRVHGLLERLRVVLGGRWNPLIFLTYWRAAARTSSSVTCSA